MQDMNSAVDATFGPTYGFKDTEGMATGSVLVSAFNERRKKPSVATNRVVSCEEAREISKRPGAHVFWRRPGAGNTAEILEG
jgi:hypothetical protein